MRTAFFLALSCRLAQAAPRRAKQHALLPAVANETAFVPRQVKIAQGGKAAKECHELYDTFSNTCVCSNGGCASHTACTPTPFCNASTTASAIAQLRREAGPGMLQEAPTELLLPKRATILMFLMFNSSHVRPCHHNKYDKRYNPPRHAGYMREFNRVMNFVASSKNVSTALPIHVVVGGEREYSAEKELIAAGVTLISSKFIHSHSWGSKMHMHTFSKLAALNMTQFDKVILVDNDCIMLRNIDHLQHAPTPAAAWHAGMCEDSANCFFNSGVMVLKPDAAEFGRLMTYYESLASERHQKGRHADGGDQEVWSGFYEQIHELPTSYNAHRGLLMAEKEWRKVHMIHAISGWEYLKRSPPYLDDFVRVFY